MPQQAREHRGAPGSEGSSTVEGKAEQRKTPRATSARFWCVVSRNHLFPSGRGAAECAHPKAPLFSSNLGVSQLPAPGTLSLPRPPASPALEQKFTFQLILQIFLLCWRSAFPAGPEEKAPVVSSKTKVKRAAAAQRGGKCRGFRGWGDEVVPRACGRHCCPGPSPGLGLDVRDPLSKQCHPWYTPL